MNVRGTILLAAGALLASRALAQGAAGESQEKPPTDEKTWYQKDADKARELGQEGADATKKGATTAKEKVNEGGHAATAKVVGTKTVTAKVADVSKDQVTLKLKKSDGTPMNLRLTDSTKVTVAGEKGSVGSLHQGDEVRASYYESGGSATATKIDVKRK
jgi:hypothetical protein